MYAGLFKSDVMSTVECSRCEIKIIWVQMVLGEFLDSLFIGYYNECHNICCYSFIKFVAYHESIWLSGVKLPVYLFKVINAWIDASSNLFFFVFQCKLIFFCRILSMRCKLSDQYVYLVRFLTNGVDWKRQSWSVCSFFQQNKEIEL